MTESSRPSSSANTGSGSDSDPSSDSRDADHAGGTGNAGEAPISRARAHYTLAILLVIFVFSHIDRNILNVLLEPIKAEFGTSDFAMGLLTGLSFVLFYTAVGVPIARMADRQSRKHIILWGLTLWSLMTAIQGVARSFWHLAAARLLVGVGEATAAPSSHSMIADLYPPDRRALPLGIYAMGGHIGMLIGFVLGGAIAESFGWRMAFLVVGLPGLALAVLAALTVSEPPRGYSEQRTATSDQAPLGAVLRYLATCPSFRNLNIAAALYSGVAYTFNIFGVAYMQRIHGMGLAEAGFQFGIATGIPGILGTLVAGELVDRLARRDVRWASWIPAIGGAAMLPFSYAFIAADDPQTGLWFYAVQVFLGTFWMGPAFSTAQGLATLRMRSTASAVFLLFVNAIGLALVPAVVGLMSDQFSLTYGSDGLRYALYVLATLNLWGALHSLLVSRTLERDLAAAAEA